MEENKEIDERVHQQLVYKDNRIIDLNNVILDKERQILDLQERVREHNEVNTVKNQAMRIVQQKFEEMNRDKKDMSTETDPGLLALGPSTSGTPKTERRTRSSSPGHVIAARKSVASTSSGTFSPPPLDPPFESPNSKLSGLPDIDGIHRKNHQRKRVTFDLNPNSSSSSSSRHQHITTSVSDALESENAILRQQVVDLNASVELMKAEYEAEIVKYTKEAKTAGLKAKVAATARIKELEGTLENINGRWKDETDRLGEEVSTLRSSRNWEIEQNAQLRDQVAHLKEKAHKLNEELDASEKNKRSLDSEVEESQKLMAMMVEDLQQAEISLNFMKNQKIAIFEDIDRMKEAIVAQDNYIQVLEADNVIYEQHIGLLRENLGASQIDHRALIKSKAFETKLLALEREKEKSDKKSNEDRLKTKALDKKCRLLVEQNEQLMARLCELEMSGGKGSDESVTRRLAEQDERIRQVSSALESERDVSQRLREAKEALERELFSKRKQEEASNSRRQMDVEMSRMEAQNKVEEMSVEVEAAHKKVADVMAEVEQLRATNFDLQMHIETARRTIEELADSNELLEKQIEQDEEAIEEKEEDLKQSTWDVETLTRQNEALSPDCRVELDGVRQGIHETRDLVEEVKHLKSELTRQQEVHRAQFEDACRKLDEEDVAERKTSLEVQQEEYIKAYEEKIESMNIQMDELKAERESLIRTLDEKNAELLKIGPVQRKTTAVLEPPKIEQIHDVLLESTPESSSLQNPFSEAEASLVKELTEEVQLLKQKNADFAEKMERLEMETKLSGELNVELGRAMLELEEHNELLRREQETVMADDVATGRELELHVMMVQEMTEQIASMQKRIDEAEKYKLEVSSVKHENQQVKSEMERLLHNLAESEIARRNELENAAVEHDTEVRSLSIKLEDSRREIMDLEEKLREAKEKVPAAPVVVLEPPAIRETQILTAATPEVPEVSEVRDFREDVSQNMQKLIELKDELEIAIQALKAEIWSLNGQLKASILDREGLENRVTILDDQVEKEKKRAIALDVELQEQIDLTDRAVRRAAEAENESNQRMAECLEKETRREEIEKAYTQLNDYYNQLQEAYNNVYAQLAAATSSEPSTSESQLTTSCSAPNHLEPLVDGIMTILLIVRESSISLSSQQKLEKISEKLKKLMEEYEENQTALEEQRRISEALEQRLQTIEGNSDDVTTTRERVEQLEGEIEWKEEECEGLKRRIRELEKALEAVAERADETEAARLTTRQADVDSLFRTNAELAHTNVRLQNEVDEMEELKIKIIEEKQQLEDHVKELELQVAELMEQHELHLQQTQVLQTPNDNSAELEESQKEVERLASIEKTLNTRILALEDQNMELEEKYQEMEEQMMSVQKEAMENLEKKQAETDWDSWGKKKTDSGENEEMERLLESEKALTMKVEVLEIQNKEMEQKLKTLEEAKEEEQKEKPSSTAPPPTDDDDWGWGNETEKAPLKSEESEDWGWGEEKTSEAPESSEELTLAKSEVERLTQIEKILQNRILALEEQNMELEERLQEMEEELKEEREKEKEKKDDDWGGWDEEEKKTEKNEEDVEELQNTISQLQERLKFQKEVIEKVEAELIEQQDKYDELEENFEKSQQSQEAAEQLLKQLENLKSELAAAHSEMSQLESRLDALEQEKRQLEERIRELEEENQKKEKTDTENEDSEGGWDDDGWGDGEEENQKKDKEDSQEIQQLRDSEAQLTEQNAKLEAEIHSQRLELDQMAENITLEQTRRLKIEEELRKSNDELEDVKKQLNQKEEEATSSGWNGDDWNDNGEVETLKENLKMLEIRVEALQNELFEVKEREQTLIETNSSLQNQLSSVQQELLEVQQKAEEPSGWNDADGWNNEEDEVKKALESELTKRNETIERLQEQISSLQKDLLEASESSDLHTLEELESVKNQLRVVTEQNGILKDSEARLMDHADEYASQMDKYQEKCQVLTKKVTELEADIQKRTLEENKEKESSDELVKLRQQLSNSQQEVRTQSSRISDREGLISELRLQISEQSKTIEELSLKLKTLSTARRVAPSRVSMSSNHGNPMMTSSRPNSRLSTSSRISTASSFVPEATAVPLQSTGSAFDVVVPQSGEPLRRRNK